MITHCVAKAREKFFSRQDVMVHRAEFPVEKGFSCLVLGVTLSCVERRGDGSERGTLPNRGRRDVYGTL